MKVENVEPDVENAFIGQTSEERRYREMENSPEERKMIYEIIAEEPDDSTPWPNERVVKASAYKLLEKLKARKLSEENW